LVYVIGGYDVEKSSGDEGPSIPAQVNTFIIEVPI